MHAYTKSPNNIIDFKSYKIFSFLEKNDTNIDWKTVESFGEEWSKFNFFSEQEIKQAGDEYFDIIDSSILTKDTVVLDVGCGSGRWTKYLENKVKFVEAIDPSDAVISAVQLLDSTQTRVTQASVDNIPFEDNSFDLVFSLGVLHHIPDTKRALKKCVEKVKIRGYFMVYLYYSLDNRGLFYKMLFKLSNSFRWVISKLPSVLKKIVCDVISIIIYAPFAFLARSFLFFGLNKIAKKLPLYNYHDKPFKLLRNDSLDRFGTPLEQRFSKSEIKKMMEDSGLINIKFSQKEPFWHAVGQKK